MKLEPAELGLKNPKDHLNLTLYKHNHKDLDLHHAYYKDHQISRPPDLQVSYIFTKIDLKTLDQTYPMKEKVTHLVFPHQWPSTTT